MNFKFVITVMIIPLLILSGCAPPPANEQASKVETNLQFSVKQESQLVESIGAPYEITVDNCKGARDSEKIEERAKIYLTELILEVSNKVATEIGGNVDVVKVMLSDEIGLALGIRIGTSTEAKSSVKIVTPAGQRTVAHLQWEEVWTTGTIAISRPDGTYVDVLPFSVLNSLTLEQLDTQTINCETGSVVDNGSTEQIPIPEIPVIPPTPTPVSNCQWLQTNFPQSADDAKAKYNLPSETTFQFIYELCPSTANAFAFKANSTVEIQVPSGGCVDSWSGFTKYVGDVGTPVEDGHGGWRVYKGSVRAPEMTVRILGCK